MTISKKPIILFILLIIIIGSLFAGIRSGTNFFQKKLLTIINRELSSHIHGSLAWEHSQLSLLTNSFVLENVSFTRPKQEQLFFISAKKIRIRYNPLSFIVFPKLSFPGLYIEGVEGKWTIPSSIDDTHSHTKQAISTDLPLLKKLCHQKLLEAKKIFEKIDLREVRLEILIPDKDQKIYLHEASLSILFPPKDILTIKTQIPAIKLRKGTEAQRHRGTETETPHEKNENSCMVKIKDPYQDEDLSLANAELRLTKDSLYLDSLSLYSGLDGERISGRGEISKFFSDNPILSISYEASLDGKRLHRFYHKAPFSVLRFTTEGEIRGEIESPILTGKAKVTTLIFHDKRFPKVEKARFDYLYQKNKISLNKVILWAMSGSIYGHGEFSFPTRTFSLKASLNEVKTSNFSSASIKNIINIPSKYPLLEGNICLEGEILKDHQILGAGDLDLRFDLLPPSQNDWLSCKTHFTLSKEKKIQLTDSNLSFGKDNVIDFFGELDLDKTRGFHNFHFRSKSASLSKLENLWSPLKKGHIKGNLLCQGEISGPFSSPKINGSLIWQNAAIQKYQLQKLEGEFAYDQKRLFLSHLKIKHNQTNITINGDIATSSGKGNLEAVADPIYYIDLQEMLGLKAPILIEGSMNCKANFQILPDSQSKFYGSGQITTKKWSIADKRHPLLKQNFNSVTSSFAVDDKKFHLYETVGSGGQDKIAAELIIPYHDPEQNSTFQFSSKKFDLSCIDLIHNEHIPCDGKVSFKVQGKGGIGSGDWDWDVSILHPKYKVIQCDKAMVKLFMYGRNYHGEAEIDKNKFSISGKIENGVFYQLAGDISQITLEPSTSYFFNTDKDKERIPKIFIDLAGEVEASGYFNNFNDLTTFEQSVGTFSISKAFVRTPFHILSSTQAFNVIYHKGKISIPAGFFAGEGVEAKLSGEALLGKELDISLSGVVPMSYLGKNQSYLSDLEGDLRFDFSLQGPIDDPRFSGYLNLSQGAFGISRFNRRIENIKGDFSLDKHTIVIKNITGKTQEGKISLSGQLNFRKFKIMDGDLNLKGENILLTSNKRDKFLVGGDLRWQGSQDDSDLTGEITVWEGRSNRNVGLIESLLTRHRGIEVDEKKIDTLPRSIIGWLDNLYCDLKVHIPQNVWVTSNFFNVEISTSEFAMKGNILRPYFEGQMRTQNGLILLGGNKFQIVSGLLELTDPDQQDPSLDVYASTEIDTYHITVNIFGSIDDPQVKLSAIPYLPQSEIISMIALGISSNGRAEEGLVGQMATATGVLFSDIFGDNSPSFSGLDLFNTKILNSDILRLDLFKFKLGEESGTVEKVTLGKDITKRLQLKYSILSSDVITDEERRRLTEADYKLSDYVRLIGSRDDLGTYSLDLNFSFDF